MYIHGMIALMIILSNHNMPRVAILSVQLFKFDGHDLLIVSINKGSPPQIWHHEFIFELYFL